MRLYNYLLVPALLASVLLLASCDSTENKEILIYDGPQSEAENVELYYSEDNRVTVMMTAPLAYEFQNGDREFPKGVYLEFYNEFGRISSTLKANYAFFYKEENKWKGQGNVEVKNIEKNEQLNTEELFWMPAEEKIFTEKFVTIRQQSDVIYGEGLDAKQDLSSYRIIKPTGTLEIEE